MNLMAKRRPRERWITAVVFSGQCECCEAPLYYRKVVDMIGWTPQCYNLRLPCPACSERQFDDYLENHGNPERVQPDTYQLCDIILDYDHWATAHYYDQERGTLWEGHLPRNQSVTAGASVSRHHRKRKAAAPPGPGRRTSKSS